MVPLYSGGRARGAVLSEAHNLIIQSIEQHIHFIVLHISSPYSAGSLASPRNRNTVTLRFLERRRKKVKFKKKSLR